MRRYKVTAAAVLGLTLGALASAPADAWNRGNVQVLTVLPDLVGQVQSGVKSSAEGLTVGRDGNIYVTTFGFNTQGGTTGPGNLIVISPNGKIVNQVAIKCTNCAATSPHMLGLRFNPMTGALWVLDFGAGYVLNVDPSTGSATALAPQFPPPPGSALNALTFDTAGNGYVSDSFAGVIWQIPPNGTQGKPAVAWKTDALLLGNGTPFVPFGSLTPPFGANGVEFSNGKLFVANTAFHQII
jgi:hypothetical protein